MELFMFDGGKMLCFVNILEIVYFGNINILYSCIFNSKKKFLKFVYIFEFLLVIGIILF